LNSDLSLKWLWLWICRPKKLLQSSVKTSKVKLKLAAEKVGGSEKMNCFTICFIQGSKLLSQFSEIFANFRRKFCVLLRILINVMIQI
jgi:hypothetical protein